MIFSVSNDGIEWSLDYGPDSVTLTVKDLVQEKTICSQEFPLAAWSLLLSPGLDCLKNHLAHVLITAIQGGTMEMKDEVLSSVGAQERVTEGHQVSDPDGFVLYWETDQLDADAVFTSGIDSLFSPTAFDDLEKVGSAENPFCSTKCRTRGTVLQQHQSLRDQNNHLQPPTLLRSCPSGTRIEIVPDYVFKKFSKSITVYVF